MNLTPITELTVESGTAAALSQWLLGWFDGGSHAVGNHAAVVFPKADVSFGQSPLTTQPLNGLQLLVVMLAKDKTSTPHTDALGAGSYVRERVQLQLWILAKRDGSGQSAALSQQAADLLLAILNNPVSRADLAAAGIMNVNPHKARPVESVDTDKRLLSCGIELNYRVLYDSWGTAATVSGSAPVLEDAARIVPLLFVQPGALVPGDYLLGGYAFVRGTSVWSATLTVTKTSTANTVLALLANGTATGLQLVLPAGTLTVTVPTTLTVNPNALMQWQVVQASADPNLAALGASVTMRTSAVF